MNRSVVLTTLLACLAVANAQTKKMESKTESKTTKISRAVSAAPASIAKAAKVVDMDDKGNEIVLREGTNGFTCYPGHPGVVGGQPFCANEAAVQWEEISQRTNLSPRTANPESSTCCKAEQTGAAAIPTLHRARRSRNRRIG